MDAQIEEVMAQRDIALLSVAWTWFKRGFEDLSIRVGDITYDDRTVRVMFTIQKKNRYHRYCPTCIEEVRDSRDAKNSHKANFCKRCGRNIKGVPLTIGKRQPSVAIKTRRRDDPFMDNIVKWVDKMKELGAKDEDFLFPPFKLKSHGLSIGAIPRVKDAVDNSKANMMSVQRFDQILQRLDYTLTSSMFRYGHTEQLFRLGYTSRELMDLGDWGSTMMPEIYSKKAGTTPSQLRFEQDKNA
jgi:hypothetical protein